ncbi:MAG: glycosyltransferase [Pedobacter sp.]|nr:MAG: glycosyltransferase [Pedobacter sp.]
MRIFIVAPFCSLPGEPYFNRFLRLATMLAERHEVILITSRFRHFDKTQRTVLEYAKNFSIVLIEEPGYKKNVSLSRVWSHACFFRNFKLWFEGEMRRKKVDVVYSAYPLISTNIYLGSVKKKFDFKLIIDVQDIWPESIASVIPLLRHINPRFLPFSGKADKAYKSADALVAVSDTYLCRAKLVNLEAPSKVVYIGCEGLKVEKLNPFDSESKVINFVYVGTLSHSYDLKTVVRGFSKIWNDGERRMMLHVLGDGPDRKELEILASPNTKFYGFIDYSKMLSFIGRADVCINALSVGAQQSITNKFCDYMLLGKCIVNSQTNMEVLSILKNFSHINYLAGNLDSFILAVKSSINVKKDRPDPSLLKEFDRSFSYPELIRFIEFSHRQLSA